jgi:4-amino-4-deoxy-L-arabinose transferase-like glycosyltransferase
VIAVGLAAVLAAVVRLVYIWFDRRDFVFGGDAYYYHQGANLLADGEGFIHPFGWLEGKSVESADHPPLYIVYLAGWSLMGVRTTTGHMVASALIGVASVVVAALVGRRVGGERVGVVAAVLLALAPNVWRYDGMLMSETMVILVVLVTVFLAYRFWDRRTPGRLVVLGVAVGVATLARSELLLLGPLLVLPLALLTKERSWGWRIGWLAASAGAVVAVLTPWLVLNQTRFDEPVYLSQNLGGTITVSYCDTVFEGPLLGYWDFNCGPRVLAPLGLLELGSPGVDAAMREAGLEFASENLDRLPVVVAARLGRIVGVFRPQQQRDLDVFMESTTRTVATAGMITLPFSIVGAVAGAVVLRRRRVPVIPLLAPIACVVVTVALFYAATRFRATAEGPIYVLSAVALVALWDQGRRWLRRSPAAHDGG